MKALLEREINRRNMVKQQLVPRGIKDLRVLEAMKRVPRHLFVPEEFQDRAYDDAPLPIGGGQTISQPYIVALMSESLGLNGEEKVLEIGTGSGYQAAILAELARWVYTIERISSLSKTAQRILSQLGFDTVSFRVGDGTLGWPEEAPFDAIIVTAAAPIVSHILVDQLNENGRLVIPVGTQQQQRLVLLTKQTGRIYTDDLGECIFVPLIGTHGYRT